METGAWRRRWGSVQCCSQFLSGCCVPLGRSLALSGHLSILSPIPRTPQQELAPNSPDFRGRAQAQDNVFIQRRSSILIALGDLYLLCPAPGHLCSPWRRSGGCPCHSSPAGWHLAHGGPRSRSSVDTQKRQGTLRTCVCVPAAPGKAEPPVASISGPHTGHIPCSHIKSFFGPQQWIFLP